MRLCYNLSSLPWRYRLGVRTEDSQSSNPGSIPGSATKPFSILLIRNAFPNSLSPVELHLNYMQHFRFRIIAGSPGNSVMNIEVTVGEIKVTINERVKLDGRWTRILFDIPDGHRRDGRLFLKDERQGKFQLSWYEKRCKKLQDVTNPTNGNCPFFPMR
jgi:hypothetical protein